MKMSIIAVDHNKLSLLVVYMQEDYYPYLIMSRP